MGVADAAFSTYQSEYESPPVSSNFTYTVTLVPGVTFSGNSSVWVSCGTKLPFWLRNQ